MESAGGDGPFHAISGWQRASRKRIRGALLALCALAGAGGAGADSSTERGLPIFQTYGADLYRAHNEVPSAARAPDGRMYFGSIVSLIQFDGNSFRKFPSVTPWVWAILPAADGGIYVAGENEFGVFERGDDGALAYRSLLPSVPESFRPVGWVRTIVERTDGIYFGTGRGIVRWQAGQARVWPMAEARMINLFADGGDLYLHHPNEGLFRLAGEEWRPVSTSPELLRNQRAWLDRLPDGSVVMGLFRDGILRLDGDRLVPWPNEAAGILSHAPTTCGRVLRDGTLAVGTATDGFVLLSPDGKLIGHYSEASGLVQNTVFSLVEDADGGVWATTRNGIVRLDRRLRASQFDDRNGYPAREAVEMLRHAGRLYVVQIGGEVLQLAAQSDAAAASARFTRVPGLPPTIYGAAGHPAGLLLAHEGGFTIWDGERARPGPMVPGVAKKLLVPRLHPRMVFIGTDTGVRLFDWTSTAWVPIAEWPFPAEVQDLAEDIDGSIWVGLSAFGYARLPALQPGQDWRSLPPVLYRRDRDLPADHSWFMARPTPIGAVLYTEKDVFRLAPGGDRLVPDDRFVGPDGGRINLSPQTVAPDGTIWAVGSRPGAPDPYAPDYPFGFLALEGDHLRWRDPRSAWRKLVGPLGPYVQLAERDGANQVLWAATAKTLLRFEFETAAPEPREFTVGIESISRAGQRIDPRGSGIPYSPKPISIRLSANRFDLGADVRFETRVVGFDPAWSEPSADRVTLIPALGGGSYVFEARAIDADGNRSEIAARRFRIGSPPYLSWWAWTLYALGAIALFQSAVRVRLRKTQAEQRRLEGLVAERTRQLARATAAAEEANQAKSRFLANMSHELRTPLNGILGFAQILARDPEMSDANRDRLRIVRSAGDQLLGLVNDVLDLAKIEAGRLEAKPVDFRLADLLRDIEGAVAPRAQAKGLALRIEASEAPVQVLRADETRLRQILDNLIGNALKYTARGEVRVVARAVPGTDRVAFEVRDTGAGMNADDLARVFRPFEQAVTGRPAESGAGLGLAISQRLAELLGGRIEADSRLGEGSCFRFELPLPPAPAEGSLSEPSSPAPGRIVGYDGAPRSILVVDDVELNRRVLRELLEPLGFAVHEAASGEAALEALARGPCDLTIVDLRMPGMDGFELARRLAALPGGGPKRIATSASVLSFHRESARAAGYDDFLPKPFREERLLEIVGGVLGVSWRRAAPPAPAAATPAAPGVEPDGAVLDAWMALADRGDVVALRAAIREFLLAHPGGALARQIDALAAGFQMTAIRERLREARGR